MEIRMNYWLLLVTLLLATACGTSSSTSPESYECIDNEHKVVFEGESEQCHLKKDVEIQGVPCAAAREAAFYHPSGKLMRCHLSREATIAGVKIPARTRVVLFEGGTLRSLHAHPSHAKVKERLCVRASFHPDGQLESCVSTQGEEACFLAEGREVPCDEVIEKRSVGSSIGE
jgi:hypothetical protein